MTNARYGFRATGMLLAAAALLLAAPGYSATVYVTDYGAVGTGNEADASTNVQAFADASAAAGNGGTVLVPSGTYYVDAQIFGDQDDQTLRGIGTAVIKRTSYDPNDPNTTGGMTMIYPSRNSCTIEDLTIDGNRSDPNQSPWSMGIVIDRYRGNVTIRNCTVQGTGYYGIYIANGFGTVTVDNCTLINNPGHGIAITDSVGSTITGCSFSGNGWDGLDMEPDNRHTFGHTISGCTFDGDNLQTYGGGRDNGYGLALPWNVRVEGCNFINGANLQCIHSMNVVVVNNTFNGGGIRFNDQPREAHHNGMGYITLSGNTIAGVSSNGVNLLVNPSFESWAGNNADGWTAAGSGTYTVEPAEQAIRVLDGVRAAHVQADPGSTVYLEQTVSVTAGKYYTFGGYISRLKDPNGWPALIAFEFLDSGGGVLKYIGLHPYHTKYLKYALYEKVMTIAKAPAGAVSARVRVGRVDPTESIEAYYDALFLFEGIGPDNGNLAAEDEATIMRFDFGQPGDLVDPGYIHVDETTAYGYDPNTGLTYGVFNNIGDPNYSITSVNWGGWWSRRSANVLAINGLRFPRPDSYAMQSGFEVELPNGTYYVTLGGGNCAWDMRGRIQIENNIYSATENSENLRILDIAPELVDPNGVPDPSGDPDGITKWLVTSDLDLHQPNYYGFVYTWGLNRQANPGDPPYYWKFAEILYLVDQPVKVTDGKLTVYGTHNDRDQSDPEDDLFELNFVEIVPVPAADCNELWQLGFGLEADLDHDCDVDVDDLAILAADWLTCNDPNNPNCTENW